MKQTIAIFIAFLLLLASVIYLVNITNTLNRKIDGLQQEPTQVSNNCLTVVLVTIPDQEPESEPDQEPTTPTEPELDQESTIPNIEPTTPKPTNYYGRLVVPDADISVGLYLGADQAICDRQDSANLFTMSVFDGLYISDHNNQEFAKLFNVTVGMRGYLQTASGETLNIVCTDVLTGHNTGDYIVDENGNGNLDADFLMYTCRDGWRNILICLWKHC